MLRQPQDVDVASSAAAPHGSTAEPAASGSTSNAFPGRPSESVADRVVDSFRMRPPTAGDRVSAAMMARPAGTPISNLVAGLVNDTASRGISSDVGMRPTTPGSVSAAAASGSTSVDASMRPSTPGGLPATADSGSTPSDVGMGVTEGGGMSAAAESRQGRTPVSHVVDSLVEDAIFDEGLSGSEAGPSGPDSLFPSPRGVGQGLLERPHTASGLSVTATLDQAEDVRVSMPHAMQIIQNEPDYLHATSSEALALDDVTPEAADAGLDKSALAAQWSEPQPAEVQRDTSAETSEGGVPDRLSKVADEAIMPDEPPAGYTTGVAKGLAEIDVADATSML